MICRKINIYLVLVLCACSMILSSILAQEKKSPIRLERAKILRNTTAGGEQIKELIGDVIITRDDMKIECQQAFHYQVADKIVFVKEVHYSDSLREMWADKIIYYVNKDSMEAEGSVKIVQDEYESYSRKAYYSEERRKVYLRENVKILNLENHVTMTGKRGFGDESMKYARVRGNAEMIKKDSLDKIEMTVDAVEIEYFNADDYAQAKDSVKIYQGDVTGNCGLMTYFLKDKKTLMVDNPMIFRDPDELEGDSIYLYLKDEKLEKIEIFGNASVISPVEESEKDEKNQMYGKRMYIYIVDDNIKTIDVVGNARSIYYIFEEAQGKAPVSKGANSVSGDKIYLFFNEGDLETIHVAGGTEGIYYPSDYQGVIE